jgi:dihydroorotase
MIKRIDPHVHCRGRKEDYKESFTHIIELAESQGVYKIFAMPNTNPPIVRRADVEEYLGKVPAAYEGRVSVYMGVTANENQLREAMDCIDDLKEVVGLKGFWGSSTGQLLVGTPAEQSLVYKALVEGGYKGVLAGHCEDEDIIKKNKEKWDVSRPITHGLARPKIAEITSVKNQISMAEAAGFKGKLYICHASCPESVEAVSEAKRRGLINAFCEVTPHHVLLNEKEMEHPIAGRFFKINPPLRSKEDQEALIAKVLLGEVDTCGSDCAAHAIADKMDRKKDPPSGYPSLIIYDESLDFLRQRGLPEERIDAMTYYNIKEIFGDKAA